MSKQSKNTPENNPEIITVTINKDASLEEVIRALEPVWENLHEREQTEYILFAKSKGEVATRASASKFSFVSSLAAHIQAVSNLKG